MSAIIKKRNLLPFFDMAYQVIGEAGTRKNQILLHNKVELNL